MYYIVDETQHPMPVTVSLFDLIGQKASAGYLFTSRQVQISACILLFDNRQEKYLGNLSSA